MWPTHYIPNQPRVEGTPPPRYYLTTPPYPVEVTEELAAGPASSSGGSFGIGSNDEIESAAMFVGGTMEQKGYELIEAEDEIESAAVFVSGELRDVLIRCETGEEIESAAVFVSGEMRDPLVTYENWPLGAATEDLLGAASFVSGVLT